MKMYLLQKQVFKEGYRFFMTMFVSVLFLVMIFYVNIGKEENFITHYLLAILMMIYAVGGPMIVFSNTYHLTDVHHVASFPMTRLESFFSRYFVGLVFGMLLVLSYTSLTSLLAQTQNVWIFNTTHLMTIFVYYYHLYVFCFWICGNKLFYGLMAILCTIGPLLLFMVYQWVMTIFAVGYICPSLAQSGIEIFLPITHIFTAIAQGSVDGYLLFYLGLAVVFLVLTLIAVRYRPYEKTGQSITFDLLGYLIRFFITLLVSSLILALVSSISGQNDPISIFISFLVICLIVVYCTEMLFTKKSYVFYSLKYGILLSIIGFIFINGSSRYVSSYIPKNVESVSFTLSGYQTSSVSVKNQKVITLIKALHQSILDNPENISSITNWESSDHTLRIVYKISENRYSERFYYVDDRFYLSTVIPYLKNREIFDMVIEMENVILDKVVDQTGYLMISIEGRNYYIDTDEKRYLFKNYLSQQIEEAYQNSDNYGLNQEDKVYVNAWWIQDNQNETLLCYGDSEIIEKALIKTFKE